MPDNCTISCIRSCLIFLPFAPSDHVWSFIPLLRHHIWWFTPLTLAPGCSINSHVWSFASFWMRLWLANNEPGDGTNNETDCSVVIKLTELTMDLVNELTIKLMVQLGIKVTEWTMSLVTEIIVKLVTEIMVKLVTDLTVTLVVDLEVKLMIEPAMKLMVSLR